MVEGPGCKVKGETLKPRVRGQRLKSVGGNAVDKYRKKGKTKKSNSPETPSTDPTTPATPYDVMIGARCSDIQTLGKEFFMFFDGVTMCLRIHFLMAGGFRVNGQKLDHEGDTTAQTFSIVLEFDKDTVTFHKCAADMRPAAECLQKINNLRSLDICVSVFSHQRAAELVAAQSGRMVCDVLLDQLILPGVGNIIKNEALFDSGIHPDTKVEQLSEAHVSHLVKMTRDFSMIFYKCRKEGKSLHPYLKIYRKGQCKQCNGKTVTTRLGDDSTRLTTFCHNCQTNDIDKLRQWKLPVKNSLLGWISSSKTEVKKEDWTCNVCTLINTATRSSCAACGVAKEDPLVDQMRNKTNCNVNNGHTFCASSAGMSKNNVVGTSCNTNQGNMYATPFRKRLRSGGDNLASPSIENCSPSHASFDMNLLDSPEAVKPESKKLKSQSPSPKFPNKLIVANTPMTRNQLHATQTSTNHTPSRTMSPMNSSVNTQSSKQSLSPSGQGVQTPILPPTLCTIHKKKCIMREVRKESQNKGRMFYSCPVRNCNYFLWADDSFPICEGHGKKCAIRTVMKQGPNNGRRFFACSHGKKKTCQFFKWADQYNETTIR